MPSMLTIPEIAVKHAKKQPELVDAITEDAPALQKFLWHPSSHGLWNLAQKITSVTGAGFVPMNAPLQEMSVTSDLKKVDLSIMGGIFEVPEVTAIEYGGKDKYLADNLDIIYRDSGQSAEKAILYNKIKAAAITYDCLVRAQPANSAGQTYSVLCLRMRKGEHGGLYDPAMFKQGTLLETVPIHGGFVYRSTSENPKLKGVLVYGWRSMGFFGWQNMVENAAAAIVNIDEAHPITAAHMDALLQKARRRKGGTTLIVAHPNLEGMINAIKRNYLRLSNADKNIQSNLDAWEGIPIIYTENMLEGTETPV